MQDKLGLTHLVGTPLLRAYMHGFFVDNRLYSKVGGGWWRCRGGVLLLLLLLPLTFTAALTFAGLPTTAAPAAAVQRPSLLLTSLLLRCGW